MLREGEALRRGEALRGGEAGSGPPLQILMILAVPSCPCFTSAWP